MAELEGQEKYRKHILEKKNELKLGNSELAINLKKLGWRQRSLDRTLISEVNTWVSKRKPIHPDAVKYLALLFQLPYDTPEKVEADSQFGKPCWSKTMWTQWRKRATEFDRGIAPSGFDALLHRLDEAQERAKDSLIEDRKHFVQLIAAMNQLHLVFVTTLTELPVTFIQGINDEHRSLVEAYYEGIANGALVCIVIPSCATLDNLKKQFSYIKVEKYNDLWDGYERFRQGLIEYLKGPKMAKNAEEYADTHLQMLDFESFPLTPAGWTISLLGIRKPPRGVSHRIILRAPERRGVGPRLIESIEQYSDLISDYAMSILDFYDAGHRADDTVKKRTSHCDVKGTKADRRKTFLNNYMKRLLGDVDSKSVSLIKV